MGVGRMSNSIWKTPDQKPDVFKPHTIMVVYEAHDEPELMFSTEYATLTANRYVNRWCYWDEFIAQADKAERLQKAVDLAIRGLEKVHRANSCITKESQIAYEYLKEIKQLIKG